MKPLRLALIHRAHWYSQEPRVDGQFAYEVPGLTWRHVNVDKTFALSIAWNDVDVVWMDDGKYADMVITPAKGNRTMPLAFYCLYPTLAGNIFKDRVNRAKQFADLVLLDHDNVQKWAQEGLVARRLAYSVNERYYRDRGLQRDIDVGFYCIWGHNPARPAFERWLGDFCLRKGYRFHGLKGNGVGTSYPELLARTKVVVHLNRTAYTRPPRIFDAAASGAALLSNPMPSVSGEYWQPFTHYWPFYNPVDQYQEGAPRVAEFTDEECSEVIDGLVALLDGGEWEPVAQNAKSYVLACHTWEQRAKELRGILLDVFPRLRKQAGEEWAYQEVK